MQMLIPETLFWDLKSFSLRKLQAIVDDTKWTVSQWQTTYELCVSQGYKL